MHTDDVKALLAARHAAFTNRDVDGLTALYAEAIVLDSPAAGGSVTGRGAIERMYRSWFEAFPDFTLEDEHYVIEGGEIAHIATAVGTNIGGFMGLPPPVSPSTSISRSCSPSNTAKSSASAVFTTSPGCWSRLVC
jgi:predicted ester cyclase